ncbi:MAG: succinylglutamate desuccinylase/aspartoacylase family protein [Candidatus Levyibacteriota bacterium]
MKENVTRLERLMSLDGLVRIDNPIMLAEIGSGSPVLAITAAMHGDEETGVFILDIVRKNIRPERGTVRLIVANPPALFRGVRFVNGDMNRAFPGDKGSIGEKGIAADVLDIVEDSDFTIDLHTSSSPTQTFAIVGNKEKRRVELAEMAGVKKILYIPKQNSYAMIDFVKCGIGIELGLHNSQYAYDSGLLLINNVLNRLGLTTEEIGKQDDAYEYFQVTGSIPKPFSAPVQIYCQNFKLVHAGETIAKTDSKGTVLPKLSDLMTAQEDFYPILVGERAYKDIVCIKAKKISREKMIEESK